MPLRDRSINFACTNNRIDYTGSIKSAGFTQAMSTLAVGEVLEGETACSPNPMPVPAAWWRGWCDSSQAPAWPCSCPLSAGTSTVNGKFTSEMFSWSQLKSGCGHIPRWPQACQYLMLIIMVCLKKGVGHWPSQFTTKCWVIPMTGVVQETVTSCIYLTCLETYIVCVFWGTDWCRK